VVDATRQRGERHAARRQQVLAAATRLINDDQAPGSILQALANDMGLAHNTLYHYFPDRDALYRAAMERTLHLREASLAAAEAAGGRALDVFVAYMTAELSAPPHSRIVATGDQALPDRDRVRVRRAADAHRARLARLLEAGMRDGSMSACHARTRAVAIDSILDARARRAGDRRSQAEVRGDCAVLVDVLTNGLLRPGCAFPEPLPERRPVDELLGMAPEAADPGARQLQSLIGVAIDSFNRFGWEASIPDMAARVGKSKTVFYQYAVDKEDLLYLCYQHCFRLLEAAQRTATGNARSAVEETLLYYRYVYEAHGSRIGPFLLFQTVSPLKPQHRRVVGVRNRTMSLRGQDRIRRGIREGAFREVRAELVQPMFGSMLYRLAGWYENDYPLPLREVADECVRLLYEGLAARDR
jgi:AcrR family transcriptional regulator